MATKVTPFSYNGKTLSTITDEQGDVWFIAKEIAEILEYSDAHKMCSRLDDDEKSNRQIRGLGPATGGKGILLINESGLYSAILSSTKPEAKPFKKWVTSEVLPSIRKTGRYEAQQPVPQKQQSDLAPLRQQRAISLAIDNGDKIRARLPKLGDVAMQSIYAGLVNTAAGSNILPLAVLEEKHKSATEIGNILGVNRNVIGRIANQNNMKTAEYGHWELGEAEFNSSQRETFVYNAKALERFSEILSQTKPVGEAA